METIFRSQLKKRILLSFLIFLIIGTTFTFLVLLYSNRADIIGWVDALFFSGLLIFAFSWMLIISNAHLFTVAIYGVKQFISSLMRRKPTKDIIEYRDSRRQVPFYIIIVGLIIGLLFILVSFLLYYLN